MRTWQSKTDNSAPATGGILSAVEDNARGSELNNAVTSAGITLDATFAGADSDLYMLAQAMSRYASGGIFATDSGALNASVLTITGTFKPPKALFKGMRVIFHSAGGNDGHATANVFTLGIKHIVDHNGAELTGGEMATGRLVDMFYDPTALTGTGAWRLAPWANILLFSDAFSLPADAPGYLLNDGAGGLSWDAGDLRVNTVASATGNITLDGDYDITDLTLTGNITLNAVTNMHANRPHFVRFRQNGTGSRTISLNSSVFKIGAISMSASTAASAIDVMGIMMRTTAIGEIVMWNKGVQ